MANNIKNLQMYCISLEPKHLSFIKKLGYKSYYLDRQNLMSTDNLKDFSHKNNYIFIP